MTRRGSRGHPWRTNIEAATLALVVAVLFKYFLVEAYRIPTGSMQPTLMGWSDGRGGGVFDRVLVDKLSYHYRDPERFEVVVFRFPLDRSRNFVKRIVGMPGEWLKIRGGDLYRSEDRRSWEILRKPRAAQREMLLRVETHGAWAFGASSDTWSLVPDGIHARGPGHAVFPANSPGIRDNYADGYPAPLADSIQARGVLGGEHAVGDLRVESLVTVDAECTEVAFEIREDNVQYRFVIPGPAAAPDAVGGIAVAFHSSERLVEEVALRLEAGRSHQLAAQYVDKLLELEVDGEILASHVFQGGSSGGGRVALTTKGGGARFKELSVLRDIFYTTEAWEPDEWKVPEGAYFVLGDNTLNSADSREWASTRVSLHRPGGGSLHLRGEHRPEENPRIRSVPAGGENDLLGSFRDEYGELHWFSGHEASAHEAEPAPFVPRSAITGRALFVFWPIRPSLELRVPRWIH